MSSMARAHAVVVLLIFAPVALQAQEPGLHVESGAGRSRIVAVSGGSATVVRETTAAVENAAVRAVPGSPAVAVTWDELGASPGGRTHHYALSLDGRTFHPPQPARYELLLRYAQFDPLAGEPEIAPHLRAAPGSRLWIVQYWTQGLEPYRDVIRQLGGEVHLFLAHHGNVVEAGPEAVEAFRALPFVRWVGPYHPAYRLDEVLLAEAAGVAPAPAVRRLNLLTMRRGPAGHAPVNAQIAAIGGRVFAESPETHLLSAELSPAQVLALARSDAVQWIDRWSPPEDDMDIARAFHGANYVETQGGFIGTGVRVEVMDGGCDLGHPDLPSPLVHGQNSASSHGTCTSGIVCGTGAGNSAARGVMPSAQLVVADYGFLTNRYAHTADLQNPGLAYQCVLQSNSWGGGLTTSYTSTSQNMDLILFDHQRISILQSQSNDGTQSSRPEAWAKNIISVGGIRHYNTSTTADDAWSSGASIGPAADGRIKPDLASFYDSVLCTDRVGSSGYSSSNYYSGFNGTSAATPICAGHVGLLYEMWSAAAFGNAAPGATVFENRPYNTTMKALVINTAKQWVFSGTTADLTRVHQGWGHPDLQAAWDLRNDMVIVDETDTITNLGTNAYPMTVVPGTPALKATLVYRDPPGTTSSTLHRINDLNLRVTSPGGTVYWGNNGLGAGNWSTAGGSPNGVDTVENVFVQTPQAGTWLVEVIAADLNQDSHVETPGLDADYALVVTGVTPGPPPATVADFSAAPSSGSVPLIVTFTDTSTGSPTGWAWDFGDGAMSTAQNPTHTYVSPGTYTVTLTIMGPNGIDAETKAGYISVTPPPPLVSSVTPSIIEAFEGGPIVITGSGFTGTTQVQIGTVMLTPPTGFTVVNDATITLEAPSPTTLGPAFVTVTTPSGLDWGGLTYVETNPTRLSCPQITLTGSMFVWSFGAGPNDVGIVIASTSPATWDFGTPFQILLNAQIIGTGVCNAVGIGSVAFTVPPGVAGITFYSQVGAVDDVTSNFTLSNITTSTVWF